MYPRGKRMTIDLPVNSTYPGNKIQFPDIPELRSDVDKDALIFDISTFHATTIPNTFNGNPVATFAQLQNAVITLYVVGVEQQFNIPLPRLLNMQTALATDTSWVSRERMDMAPQRIDWTKSYIQACTGNLAGNTSYSFYFEVVYEWMPAGTYGKFLDQEWGKWANGIIRLQ